MMVKYYQAFDEPSDVQSLEEIYNLMWLVAYLLEFIVFLCMTISFVIALYNPPAVSLHTKWQDDEEKEQQQKQLYLSTLIQNSQVLRI